MNASVHYFPRAVIPIFIFAALAGLVPKVMDHGETMASFQMACAGFVTLILPILLRRLRKPTSMDLHLITWGLPVLFFLAINLISEAPRLPRLDINWGMVGRRWEDH